MSKYFVKRGEKIHGPYDVKQISQGIEKGKLRETDVISEDKEGPWRRIIDLIKVVHKASNKFDSPESSQTEIATAATEADNPNLIACLDCNKLVSRKAASCPHCGSPLENPNSSASKKLGQFAAKATAWASDAKTKISESETLAKVVEKSDSLAREVSGQAVELAKSTSDELKKEGLKEAGSHAIKSLKTPKYRSLAVLVGILLITILYFGWGGRSNEGTTVNYSGDVNGGLSSNFSAEVSKLRSMLRIGVTEAELRTAVQQLAIESSGSSADESLLDIYRDSLEAMTLENMTTNGESHKEQHVGIKFGEFGFAIKNGRPIDNPNSSDYEFRREHPIWVAKFFTLLAKHPDSYDVRSDDYYDEEWIIKGNDLTKFLWQKAASM